MVMSFDIVGFVNSDLHNWIQLAVVAGGIWALFVYTKSRRYNAAVWINKLFEEFYIKDTFKEIKKILSIIMKML
jgi:hypothetical protein